MSVELSLLKCKDSIKIRLTSWFYRIHSVMIYHKVVNELWKASSTSNLTGWLRYRIHWTLKTFHLTKNNSKHHLGSHLRNVAGCLHLRHFKFRELTHAKWVRFVINLASLPPPIFGLANLPPSIFGFRSQSLLPWQSFICDKVGNIVSLQFLFEGLSAYPKTEATAARSLSEPDLFTCCHLNPETLPKFYIEL